MAKIVNTFICDNCKSNVNENMKINKSIIKFNQLINLLNEKNKNFTTIEHKLTYLLKLNNKNKQLNELKKIIEKHNINMSEIIVLCHTINLNLTTTIEPDDNNIYNISFTDDDIDV